MTMTRVWMHREKENVWVIARSVSDEAIQGRLALSAGLLRCARNDEEKYPPPISWGRDVLFDIVDRKK